MRISGVPALLWAVAALALLTAAPAALAAFDGEWRAARGFLFGGGFGLAVAAILGAAARRTGAPARPGREELSTLFALFAAGPIWGAAPIWLIMPELGPFGAWFEAVSCLTTTGASIVEGGPRALHLWRAMLGWAGGFATLVAAAAVLAPRELLDLPGAAPAGQLKAGGGRMLALAPGGRRVLRAAGVLAPLYGGFTAVAMVALEAFGASGFEAVVTAMGVVSTSGIGVGAGPAPLGAGAGRGAELAAALLLLVAATRWWHAWRRAGGGMGLAAGGGVFGRREAMRRDPEFRLAGFAIAVGALALWLPGIGGWEGTVEGAGRALVAFWGGAATVISFLTTTGYVSADWAAAEAWAGRGPGDAGLLLAGLATLGGGVATTAGGVKLYRAYALYRHGTAELARLPQPSLVNSTRTRGGPIQRRGVISAWAVVMLHLVALASATLAIGAAGPDFGVALTAAVAALSNVGPLLPVAAPGTEWAALPAPAQAAAAAAMVVGRVELVAAAALLNPSWWGR